MKLFVVVLLIALASVGESRVYSECDLARELSRYFPRGQLEQWVCLVMSESSGRTRVRGPVNSDGSYDHGLFQINDAYWCGNGWQGGICNINCAYLRDDNIADDVQCVRRIYARHKFSAWTGWRKKCQQRWNLPNIRGNCGF